ncbi:hypothetical protein Tco_0892684 [Tanacetum coccineum]|uniref:Uncharacterized protein n=1 Tax=Tanacetum coccineum TaxID=301880 RepID=A0ABQ5C8B7_9ASTR
MTDLIFADSHNMVAYREKLEDNADFAEIVDFLNASPIKYALTTIVISESSVRRDLQFNDEDGTVTPLFATMLIQSQAVEGEGSGQPTQPQHTPTTASLSHVEQIPIAASSSQPKKTQKHRKTKRKATKISQSSGPTTLVADETVHEERRDSVERAATTTTSLDAEHGSGNINRTQSIATLNEPIPQGTGLGSGPRRQDTILGDRPAQTRFERLSKQSNEPPLSRVNTLGSERTLKKRVKKLESKKSRTPQIKRRLFKVRIEFSVEKSLGNSEDASKQKKNEIDQDEVVILLLLSYYSSKCTNYYCWCIMKSAKSKAKGVTMQEPSKSGTRVRVPPPQIYPKDKEKAKMVEPEKPKKMKDQIEYDVDEQEREELIIEERSKLFVELMNERKKHFARLRAEEQRRKPPTKTQKRNLMKVIRVGNHTEVYHFFDDMLKAFDKDDLVMLWSLVKEKFNSTEPIDHKEREIWVELKRLFEPNIDDELWKLQKNIHDLTWRLYDSCGVHHVSIEKGIDITCGREGSVLWPRGTLH